MFCIASNSFQFDFARSFQSPQPTQSFTSCPLPLPSRPSACPTPPATFGAQPSRPTLRILEFLEGFIKADCHLSEHHISLEIYSKMPPTRTIPPAKAVKVRWPSQPLGMILTSNKTDRAHSRGKPRTSIYCCVEKK